MQDSLAAAAALIYAACVVNAWQVLPGGGALKLQRTLLFPGLFLIISLIAPLAIPFLRRALSRHLWVSYRTGFGQSVISVLAGVLVLLVVAGFIVWQVHAAARGGRYPGGAFSGYGAGIGLLLAQAILVRRLERRGGPNGDGA
ncbi:MAG: hypothetical protein ACR2F8_03595 [Caulobacteraceae bacterium]